MEMENSSGIPANTTELYDYSGSGVPDWVYDFVAYWELMVAFIGTPMNLFVIFIWFTLSTRSSNRRFKTHGRNRWFILSMTCGDLLFASVHAPMMFGWYSGNIDMTDIPCYITYGSTHLSTTVSSISLLLLNVDKFIYLHWPLHYHAIMKTKRVIGMTVGAWSVAISWMLIFLFGPFMKRGEYCTWTAQHHEFYVAFLVIFFLMPILLSTATSLYIATVAVRARMREAADHASYGICNSGTSVTEFRSRSNTISEETSAYYGQSILQNGNKPLASASPVRPWRTITFVFSTTIWSTITYLPYRISFIIFTVTQIQLTWHYPLFALMVIYAAGNPFITILTQPPYRKRASDIFDQIRSTIKRLCLKGGGH